MSYGNVRKVYGEDATSRAYAYAASASILNFSTLKKTVKFKKKMDQVGPISYYYIPEELTIGQNHTH